MFPITDLDGRVIGFGGRGIGHGPGPKYLNTPETLLYKKSRTLYGLAQAKEAIRKDGVAIVVEGYFDVLLPHQAGVRNVVAACGTALTPEHLELLKRCDCRELVMLFDGDAAGARAPPQVAAAIFQAGLSARVAQLPGDPDDYVRAHGRAGLEALVAAAPALTEHLIDEAIREHTGSLRRDPRARGAEDRHRPDADAARVRVARGSCALDVRASHRAAAGTRHRRAAGGGAARFRGLRRRTSTGMTPHVLVFDNTDLGTHFGRSPSSSRESLWS